MPASLRLACRPHLRAPLIVLALLASLAASGRALAADDAKVVAKARYETGTRLYEIREYEKALTEFKEAYVVKPDPAFLFNIGQCYRKLGKNADALEFFRQYLKKAAAGDPNRALAQSRIDEIQGESAGSGAPGSAAAPAGASPAPAAASAVPPSGLGVPVAMSPADSNPAANPPPGLDLTSSATSTGPTAGQPIYTRWWFWTGVGAVVAAGTVTAIVLATRGSKNNVPGDLSLGSRPVLP
jgi:hypothetical protein